MLIKITLDDTEVKRKLSSLGRNAKSYKQPLEDIGSQLQEYYGKKVFNSQGSELGQKWKPLAPSTLMARQMRQGYYAKSPVEKNKILIWTGNLRSAFKKKAESFRLTISNPDKNFKYNQPTRPMLGINNKIVAIVERTLKKYLDNSIQ